MTSHLDKSSSLICCRCLRTKKKGVRRMPVNSSPLERSAQGGESRNLIQILSDFQTFVIQEILFQKKKMPHLTNKTSSVICCRCLRTKKKEIRRMLVNSSPLEQSAQGGESRNLIKIFQIFRLLSFNVIQYHLDKSSLLICCRCLRKKSEGCR